MAEKIKKFLINDSCVMCTKNEENEKRLGPIYHYNRDRYCFSVHYFCLLFAAGLFQKEDDEFGVVGFLPKDIIKEVSRAKTLKCSYCKIKGASIGCEKGSCREMYHLPCALRKNISRIFCGNFRVLCESHRSLPVVPAEYCRTTNEDECKICLESFDDVLPKPTWTNIFASCCKTWYHRTCIEDYAFVMKNELKCPNCRALEFQERMREWGIYVSHECPDWVTEREEDAIVVIKCSAKKCICSKGLDFHSQNSKWEIILCNYCGYEGIHIECAKLNEKRKKWTCETCSTVSSRKSDEITMNKNKLKRLRRFRKSVEKRYSSGETKSNRRNKSDQYFPSCLRNFKIILTRIDKTNLISSY